MWATGNWPSRSIVENCSGSVLILLIYHCTEVRNMCRLICNQHRGPWRRLERVTSTSSSKSLIRSWLDGMWYRSCYIMCHSCAAKMWRVYWFAVFTYFMHVTQRLCSLDVRRLLSGYIFVFLRVLPSLNELFLVEMSMNKTYDILVVDAP